MFRPAILSALLLAGCSIGVNTTREAPAPAPVFSFEKSLTLPGTPDVIFDAITGDISEWWDHSFSDHPHKLYIEPKPGGGFWEIFDDKGNGVRHATVIYADRGKLLRFEGPLGLSGKAIVLVCTYAFEPKGADETTLRLSVHGAGEFDPDTPTLVENVWHHFLFERFEPFVREGKHLRK